MSKAVSLILISIIIASIQCRQYTGTLTCGNCVQETCPFGRCYFIDGGRFHNQQDGCFNVSADTCNQYVYPFKIYECQKCLNSCCVVSPGESAYCVDQDIASKYCVFDSTNKFFGSINFIKDFKLMKNKILTREQ